MSKWGSLLQGAVANLESRLDTILAEDKEKGIKSNAASRSSQVKDAQPQDRINGKSGVSRTPSVRKTKITTAEDSVRSSIDSDRKIPRHLRTSSQDTDRERSTSRARSRQVASLPATIDTHLSETTTHDVKTAGAAESTSVENGKEAHEVDEHDTLTYSKDESRRPSVTSPDNIDRSGVSRAPLTIQGSHDGTITVEDSQVLITELKKEREEAEAHWHDETHAHLERIDALQAKLQYLAKEAVQSAQVHASEAAGDAFEQRLAAKDEQIALLMEEGQKLSKLEVSQAGLIRKLRAKAAEEARELTQVKHTLRKAEQSLKDMQEKVQMSENDASEAASKAVRLNALDRELHTLREDLKTKQVASDETKRQLEQEKRQRENLRQALSISNQSLTEERKVVQSLRDDLESCKLELRQAGETARRAAGVAEADLQREREQSQATEATLQRDVQALESRLEILRERSEEASSGMTGDTQAKLMRHIETLQTQYALASENWQGIENSLQTRLAALETEKDEASRHEVETRRKARDSSNAVRRLQEELDSTARSSKALEQELAEQRGAAEKLQARVTEFEAQLQDARAAFSQERSGWQNELITRIEEEKIKWQQEQYRMSGAESLTALPEMTMPLHPNRKFSTFERSTLPPRRNLGSRHNTSELVTHNIDTKPLSRRSSAMRLNSADWMPPTPIWEHNQSGSGSSLNLAQTPSIHEIDQDDMFEGSASPHRTAHDVVSVSTVAAGPSVQLIERISATVRRLESEKAASKDELTRLRTQRDEARQEVVSLMREIEQKREVDSRVQKYESELAGITRRYQATLEMLGEKSEEVEELKADVADLKKIYRELVDSTMK